MKKETIEEAAEKYVKHFAPSVKSAREIGFIDGAYYQAERSYSEEEMLQALNIGFTSTDETWEECVEFAKEQFKKK